MYEIPSVLRCIACNITFNTVQIIHSFSFQHYHTVIFRLFVEWTAWINMFTKDTLTDFVEIFPRGLEGVWEIQILSKSLSGKMSSLWPYYYVRRRVTDVQWKDFDQLKNDESVTNYVERTDLFLLILRVCHLGSDSRRATYLIITGHASPLCKMLCKIKYHHGDRCIMKWANVGLRNLTFVGPCIIVITEE